MLLYNVMHIYMYVVCVIDVIVYLPGDFTGTLSKRIAASERLLKTKNKLVE